MRSYYLASNKNDVDGLPRDFEVKNLESDKIYVIFQSFRSKLKSILMSLILIRKLNPSEI